MFDIHQGIVDDDGERDEKRYDAYLEGLLKAFDGSPEGRAYAEGAGGFGGWAQFFLEHYFDYLGCSLAEISVSDAREIVFELFPRKMSTEPEAAPEIVAELRAFWAFLSREFRLPQAAAIEALFNDDAIVKLKKLLADPRNYGLAKSFVMMGRAAGFDMTSEEGIQEFTAVYNASLAPLSAIAGGPLADPGDLDFPGDDAGPAPGPRRPPSKEKRKKRKAQRQARKRNRR